MFKSLGLLLLALSAFFSCQSMHRDIQRTSANNLSYEKTGRHFVVTVRGIRSEIGDDFGDAEKVLKSHLKQLRPSINYTVLSFNYPTGTDSDVFLFAYKNLSQFLKDNIKNPTMNDSIVFLAHSQGGLVASIWKAAVTYGYVNSTVVNKKYVENISNDKIYGDITDHIITVGTPYWGSNIAKLALDIGVLQSGYDAELKDMVFNSDLILWFRDLALWVSKGDPSTLSLDKTMYTNIAGIMPDLKSKLFYKNEAGRRRSNFIDSLQLDIMNGMAKRYSFSSERLSSKKPDRFESDLAVIVPSTRSNFYYADKNLTCDDSEIKSENFTQKSLYPRSRYVLTESMHTNLATDKLNRTKGMVKIPLSCLEPANCDHPTYRYILKSIAACEDQKCEPRAIERILNKLDEVKNLENKYDKVLTSGIDLQGFSLDFNLKVPADYSLPEKYYKGASHEKIKSKQLLSHIVRVNKDLMKGDFYDTFEVKVLRQRESYSGYVCWGNNTLCDSDVKDLRIHITGFIKPKSLQILSRFQNGLIERCNKGVEFPFEINLPAFKDYRPQKATVHAQVKPGYSTFVKLNFADAMACQKP